MRFIGGKSLVLPFISDLIDRKTQEVKTVGDLFSGSGVVSTMFKEKGFNTISNDLMYFCYVLLKGSIALNEVPRFEYIKSKFGNPLEYLNNANIFDADININDCFIYKSYSPIGGRMYLKENNALKIDIIRHTIEKWKTDKLINDDEYYYLLASLIEAIPYVSNIAGVYGAYLKFWDDRAYKELELTKPKLIFNNTKSAVYNLDANQLIRDIQMDLCYIDPPYNQRQYLPNYHLLETVARYDNPEIKGVTGMRDYSDEKSDYCIKGNAADAFDKLIRIVNAKYILVSYNTEGLLSTDKITEILKRYGKEKTFKLQHINYNRYKNAQTQSNKNLKEQLYFIEKEDFSA